MKKAAFALLFLIALIQFTPYGVLSSGKPEQKPPVRTAAQLEQQGLPRLMVTDKTTGQKRLETDQEYEDRAAIIVEWAKGTGY